MGLVDKLVDKVVDVATSKVGAAVIGVAGIVIASMQKGSEGETCPYCGGTMIFHESELEYLEYWKCKDCGKILTDEEFRAEQEEIEDEEETTVLDETLDIPVGCRACGGDYPNCVSSCNMFED